MSGQIDFSHVLHNNLHQYTSKAPSGTRKILLNQKLKLVLLQLSESQHETRDKGKSCR